MAGFAGFAGPGLAPPLDPCGLMGPGCVSEKVSLAYYSAYAEYARSSGACISTVGSCSSVSEPSTEPSVRSSASSGRAKRRARWRARRKERKERARESEASSGISTSVATYTSSVPVVQKRKEKSGYCYTQLLEGVPEKGPTISFGELLAIPRESVLSTSRLERFRVVRTSPGLYHITESGQVNLLDCLSSVAVSVRKEDHAFGSLGAELYQRGLGLSPRLVAKAPLLSDHLGMQVVVQDDEHSQLVDCTQVSGLSYDPGGRVLKVALGEGEVGALVSSHFFYAGFVDAETSIVIGPDCDAARSVIVRGPISTEIRLGEFVNASGRVRIVLLAEASSADAYSPLAETLAAAGCLLGAVEVCKNPAVWWGDLRYNSSRAATNYLNPDWLAKLLMPRDSGSLKSACSTRTLCRVLGLESSVAVESEFQLVNSRSALFPTCDYVVVVREEDRRYAEEVAPLGRIVTLDKVPQFGLAEVVVVSPFSRQVAGGIWDGFPITNSEASTAFACGARVKYWVPFCSGDWVEDKCRLMSGDLFSFDNC